DQRAFQQELVAHARAAYAHRTNRADLVDALHDVHGHRVHHGEEHDQAHYQRDEHEDRAEHRNDLDVERRKLSEVPHLEVETVFGNELVQPLANGGKVLGALQLQHDSRRFVLAAPIHELLRKTEVHCDVVVIELASALRLGAADSEAHDVRRSTYGRSEEIEVWQTVVPFARRGFQLRKADNVLARPP